VVVEAAEVAVVGLEVVVERYDDEKDFHYGDGDDAHDAHDGKRGDVEVCHARKYLVLQKQCMLELWAGA